jgi:hypothetical protein
MLDRTTTIIHKAVYAADILLDDIHVKGVRAEFLETASHVADGNIKPSPSDYKQDLTNRPSVKASELPSELRAWFNYYDFVDIHRRPFDRDPKVEFVDLGNCPRFSYARRIKARAFSAAAEKSGTIAPGSEDFDLETTKFGNEKSHFCLLGEASHASPTQARITRRRITELEHELRDLRRRGPSPKDRHENIEAVIVTRLKLLGDELHRLEIESERHVTDNTLQTTENGAAHTFDPDVVDKPGTVTFENTYQVHNPTVFANNVSRNVSRIRARLTIDLLSILVLEPRQETRRVPDLACVGAADVRADVSAIRGIREAMDKRSNRTKNGYNKDDLPDQHRPTNAEGVLDAATGFLHGLQGLLLDDDAKTRFELPADSVIETDDMTIPRLGLADGCEARPKQQIIVFKPQVALRSDVNNNAVVLLAVQEVTYKMFAVVDKTAPDSVAAEVLQR